MDFYLRRKDKVYGPLTEARLMELARAKKLTGEDVVGPSSKGPWQPVAEALKRGPSAPAAQAAVPADARRAGPDARPQGPSLQEREQELARREERLQQAEQALQEREQQLQEREQQLHHLQEQLQQQTGPAQPTAARHAHGQAATSGGAEAGGVLRVQRNTGTMGALTKIKVFVDGEMVAQLSALAVSDVPLPPGKHVVQVKGGGAFSGAKQEIQIEPNTVHVLDVGYSMLGGLQLTAAGIVGVGIAQMAGEGAGGIAVGNVIEAADVVQDLISFFSDE